MEITKTLDYQTLWEATSTDVYVEETMLRWHLWPGGSLVITDVADAMKTGKTCRMWILNHKNWPQPESGADIFNTIDKVAEDEAKGTPGWEESKLAWFMRKLRGLPGPTPWDDKFVLPYGVTLEIRDERSVRTYSPFAKLAPLKALPPKWTLAHTKRALANGQYTNAKCNGYYTDDYAWDAACNYRQGSISGQHLLKELVESPSGWWTSIHDGDHLRVSVCCHSFNSNEFTLRLGA